MKLKTMEESKKTCHEQENKKMRMVIKIGKGGAGAGGGAIGGVVLLGVAVLATAAMAAAAIVVGRKGRKSIKNHHQERLNKDNASKGIQLIIPNTSSSGAENMDVMEDDSASSVLTENFKLVAKSMLEINGGTQGSAHKEEGICCSEYPEKLESSVISDKPTVDSTLLLDPEFTKNEMQDRDVGIELTKEDDTVKGVGIDKTVAEDNQEMKDNVEVKKEGEGSNHGGEIGGVEYREIGTTKANQTAVVQMQLNKDDDTAKNCELQHEGIIQEGTDEADLVQLDSKPHMQLSYDDEQNICTGNPTLDKSRCEDYVKDAQTFSSPILSNSSNIITIEKLLSTEAIGVIKDDVADVATSENQEMEENNPPELVVCQEKESETVGKEVEEESETILSGINTIVYDPIMQMSEDEEKDGDNNDSNNDMDEEVFARVTGRSVGTGDTSMEYSADAILAAKSLPGVSMELQKVEGKIEEDGLVEEQPNSQQSIENLNIIAARSQISGDELTMELEQLKRNDLKEEEEEEENSQENNAEEHKFLERMENLDIVPDSGHSGQNADGQSISKMTYMVELATHNIQLSNSSRWRILIVTLLVLSWFSSTWLFGFSCVKLGLIVFLTMILSMIHVY